MKHYDGIEDDRHDDAVVKKMDDEAEARAEDARRNAAKRAASGMSPELLNLKKRAA